ncbi:MAG: superoxide dismutase [Gammaproteobacteria bacterium]|nr:superoxide dismutase [Chromatiales bacterium]MYE49024.1 superoxide dismutase [Gammaproteobacteria bacterium]
MKIFAISYRPPGTTEAAKEPQKIPEAYRAWELYKSGVFREMHWRADGKPGVVLVLECDTVDQAHEALNSLPMVIGGTLAFDVIPVGPYDHFDRLFREEFLG